MLQVSSEYELKYAFILQSGNINGADNTESNGNSNSENAVNVMFTPPGVGRRKREGDISLGETRLIANNT